MLATWRKAVRNEAWTRRVGDHENNSRAIEVNRDHYRPRLHPLPTELDECRSDAPAPEATAETALLLEEVKIGCTLGMLTCLDRPHRLAYILGEILEMDGDEAARVLAIRPAAFR